MSSLHTHHTRRLMHLTFYLALGALMPLSFAPYGWYWLQLPLLALLLIGCRNAGGWKVAFFIGWSFGLGQYLCGMRYLHVSMHEIGSMAWGSSMLVVVALSGFLALYHAIFAVVVERLGTSLLRGRAWLKFWVIASVWALLEWARGWFASGYSGFALGYAHVDGVLKTWAQWGGVELVGFWVVWMASCAAQAWTWRGRAQRRHASMCLLAGIAPAIFAFGLSLIVWTYGTGDTLSVVTLQSNQAIRERHGSFDMDGYQQPYLRLLDESNIPARVDLLVFPESVFPIAFQNMLLNLPLFERLQSLMAQHRFDVLFGTHYWVNPESRQFVTSVMHIKAGMPTRTWANADRHDKQHLIPLSEYMPAWLAFLEKLGVSFPQNTSIAGQGHAPFNVEGMPIAISQCYDVLFGRDMRRDALDAQLLVNVSNHAWFAGTDAPALNYQVARMRAIELGRPLIRADNVGVSAIISHDGATVSALPEFTSAALVATVEPRVGRTPYLRYGEWPWVALWTVIACAPLIGRARRRAWWVGRTA